MPKPKVLFCTDGVFPHSVGGIQRHTRLLLEALARKGSLELAVIHPHDSGPVFDSSLGIKEIVVSPLPGKRNYLRELYTYSQQVAEIARQHPDHLLYSQGLSVWSNSQEFGDRLIVNPHGLEPYQPLSFSDWLKGLPYRIIYRGIFKQAAKVVSLGGHLTTHLKKAVANPKRQLVVFPNATSLPDPEAIPDRFQESKDQLACLFVGRFAPNKGISFLLEAAEQMKNEAGFRFTLAGKGPLYEELKPRGQALGQVEMPGFVPDGALEGMYQQHDLLILPTLGEGMPTVILEAMAYGMPILVTDVGATRELVGPENGYLIEKQSAKSIVEALGKFQQLSPLEKQQMSQQSLHKVRERFSWEAVARQHEQLFFELSGQEMSIPSPAGS